MCSRASFAVKGPGATSAVHQRQPRHCPTAPGSPTLGRVSSPAVPGPLDPDRPPARITVPDDVELPGLSDILSSLHVVSLPMTVRFRGIQRREAALFRGPAGWTEFSPFLEYGTAEAANWLAGAIDYGWGTQVPARRDRVEVNATIPAVSAAEVPRVLAAYGPVETVKVKVAGAGSDLQQDVERVAAVRRAAGAEVRIRIDANGGWTVAQATTALEAFAPFGLEYIEQPVAALADLAEVHHRAAAVGIPIAADEAIRKAGDPERVAGLGAADLMILKAQPLGGIRRALETATRCGLPAIVSSALDTSVGLGMGTELAGALPELRHACGLATGTLLQRDVALPPLRPDRGTLPVGRCAPAPRALAAAAASPDRCTWWARRIADCLDELRTRRG